MAGTACTTQPSAPSYTLVMFTSMFCPICDSFSPSSMRSLPGAAHSRSSVPVALPPGSCGDARVPEPARRSDVRPRRRFAPPLAATAASRSFFAAATEA